MLDPILRRWALAALLASAAMLAVAHASETFGHLSPCTLCLQQRQVYWVALAVAAAGVAADLTPLKGVLGRLICLVLALTFAVGMAIAAYHAGAEWKWWPGPAACSSSGGGVSAASMAALLQGAKISAPHCDEAAWRGLGLSMAGWNVLVSAGLMIASLLAAVRKERR